MSDSGDDPDTEMRRLQLEKLRLDIKYLRRTFIAQLVNTALVVAVALLVLYLFQRPQLDQLRRNQAETAKHQALDLLISAQGISNDQDRSRVVQALSDSWPENRLLASFARSNHTLAEVRKRQLSEPTAKSGTCGRIKDDVRRLALEQANLMTAEARDIEGPGEPGNPRYIPSRAKLLRAQRESVEAELAKLDARATALGCGSD